MTLLNGILLGGALAFTIPLIIHLLFRSKFTTVDWGAWHLLESVMRTNRRRLQLTNLLLLLLRCAIPILLAFCLARPVLTGFRSLPGDAPRSIVIAIDDSRSMLAAPSGQPSRMDRAKQDLGEFLRTLTRRDEVLLVTASSVDSPAITTGASDAAEKIRALQAKSGPVDLAKLMDAATEAAEQGSHAQKSVLVVSDFQSCNIGNGTVPTLERLAERVKQSKTSPTVSFWSFADESDELSNLSVDAVTVDSPAVVAGRNAQFSARIRNSSDNPARDLRVIWSIDGVALAPRLAAVDARSTSTARLSHRIDDPGVHEVTVSVEFADALSADNRRSVAVDVMREINVVLVDGKPSRNPLEGQADFLSIALSPFAFGGDDQPDSVNAKVIRSSEIKKSLEDSKPEIVILANVGKINEGQKRLLASFVMSGGALVVFDGDQVQPDDFNEAWPGDQGGMPFPARLGGMVGDPTKRNLSDNESQSTTRIGELNPQFSPWTMLAPGEQRPLSEVEVFSYRKLSVLEPKVDESGTPIADESAGSILLRTSTGDPLVVAAQRGRGQVLQFSIPCNASWTTLPLRMVYLPMMQQMVLDLAGRRKTTTVTAGQPLAVPIAEFGQFDSLHDAKELNKDVRFTIQTPDEDEVALQPTDEQARELLWAQTALPGTYRMRQIANDAKTRSDESVITQTMRVVEIPEEESQLRVVDSDRLAGMASKLDANVYSSLEQIQSDDRTRRFGHEIWRYILLVLLIAMIGELFLQQHLISRRRTGAV